MNVCFNLACIVIRLNDLYQNVDSIYYRYKDEAQFFNLTAIVVKSSQYSCNGSELSNKDSS